MLTTLKKLANYTAEHFGIEEAMMRRHSYPGFDNQKREHTLLLAQVGKAVTGIEAGEAINLLSVITFLTDWLKEHIRKEDIEYGKFFEANGIDV